MTNQEKYKLNPKICRCGKLVPFTNKRGKFCSRSCGNKRTLSNETKMQIASTLSGKSKEKPFKIYCANCKSYICNVTKYKKNTKMYCSDKFCRKEVLSKAGRKSAQLRLSRSKDEIILYDLCKKQFNNAVPNYVIANGWDADIVLLDHKVAILWNGPWHYKDMQMKNHSLLQVQTRDKIKTKIFESLGWKVLVFEDRHYTPEKAFLVVRNEIESLT